MTSTTVDLDDLLNSPPTSAPVSVQAVDPFAFPAPVVAPLSAPVPVPVVAPSPVPGGPISPSRRVQTKDEQAEGSRREDALKREQREKAAAELAAWQEQRHRNLQMVKDAHRLHASHPVEPTGQFWEKVAALVESIPASTAGKDISKFRSTLLSLRSSPPA